MFATDALTGHAILVTGGGSGLGEAMALRFAELGAKVGVLGRRTEPLEQVVGAIEDAHGPGRAAWASADVRDRASVDAALDALEAELGPLTDVVNNAAGNFLCPSEDLSPGGFDAVVKIVLYGTFNVTQALGQRWIERGPLASVDDEDGRSYSVLSIVTTYAWMGSAFVLPSACAKAGVLALTRSLATEWASYGVRLNAIAPGPFPTEGAFSRLAIPGSEALGEKRVPLGRYGRPPELADLAVYLTCAQYVTGECVTIDGGEWLKVGQEFALITDHPRAQVKQMFAAIRAKTHTKRGA